MKKILAVALAVVLAVACAVPALAAETVTGNGWWSAEGVPSTTPVALADGETVTIKVDVAEATDDDLYAAFCVEATDGTSYVTTTSAGDIWGAGDPAARLGVADAAKGGSYTVTITRSGNNFTANYVDNATGESMHGGELTLTGNVEFGETTVYVLAQVGTLTVEVVEDSAEEPAEPTEPEEPTTPDEPEEPTEPEPTEPAEPAPEITGSLTVTSFFNEKTNTVPLKSGESYTFKFKNTSNGSANWENFLLAVIGDDNVTLGADNEILIIRADNWGWGGGKSDFAAPNESGNVLAFESDINWDEWVAAMKAGVDVTVTVKRSGNTLSYKATIGEWTVSLTATSGVALPETVHLFFTGENCTLSNIRTTSAPGAKTGDEINTCTVAILSVVAILSAVGIAVLLKKKVTD